MLLFFALASEASAGRAGGRLGPMVRSRGKSHTQCAGGKQVDRKNTRPSLRDGLTAYACSPRSSFWPSPRENRCRASGRPVHLREGLAVTTTARTTRLGRRRQPRSSHREGPHEFNRSGPTLPCQTQPRPRSLRRTIAALLGPGRRNNAVNQNFDRAEYCAGRGFAEGGAFCLRFAIGSRR